MRPRQAAAWLLMTASALLAACTHPAHQAQVGGSAVPVTFNQLFDRHFDSPARVRDLHGLALYNTAVQPEGDVAEAGRRFVVYALINNRNPLQGILVGSHTPLSLSFFRERRNSATMISGPMGVFQTPELARYYKDKHGIELATNAQGQPYWVDGLEATTAAPAPAAASTATPPAPVAQPSQPAEHDRDDDNAPYDRELVRLSPGRDLMASSQTTP